MLNKVPVVECPGCRRPLEELLEDCFLCRFCATLRFGDREKMANIADSITESREIRDCFYEDTHKGARGGGGGAKGGRRKPPRGPFGPRNFADDAWGGVGGGPWGAPDPKEKTPCDYGRADSKVVSVRLGAEERALLEHLAARHGSPASAVRAALAGLAALEHARVAQHLDAEEPGAGSGEEH